MKPVIVSELFDVPANRVWDSLSRKEELNSWYFQLQGYRLEEGQEFTFYESESTKKYFHRCRFLKIVPNKLIEYSWAHPDHSTGQSTVSWKLDPVGSGTRVTLVHSGVENFSDAGKEFSWKNYHSGWNTIVKTNLRNHLYGMEKLCFVREIRATPEMVWKIMWEDETYRVWASEFTPGSYYTGDMNKGNRIHFLAPDGHGMYSDVKECVTHERMVFSHIGWISHYKEMPVDEETGRWSGNCESYQLIPHHTGTVLRVEVEAVGEHIDFFNSKLPAALEKLGELCFTK